MESVCIGVTYKVDEETATYGWQYHGGCFEGGRLSNYKPAVPGTDYVFDHLDFEIREILPEGDGKSMFSLSGIFGFLSFLCLIGAIVAAVFLVYQYVKANRAGSTAQGGDVQMAKVQDKEKHQAFTDEQ